MGRSFVPGAAKSAQRHALPCTRSAGEARAGAPWRGGWGPAGSPRGPPETTCPGFAQARSRSTHGMEWGREGTVNTQAGFGLPAPRGGGTGGGARRLRRGRRRMGGSAPRAGAARSCCSEAPPPAGTRGGGGVTVYFSLPTRGKPRRRRRLRRGPGACQHRHEARGAPVAQREHRPVPVKHARVLAAEHLRQRVERHAVVGGRHGVDCGGGRARGESRARV